MNISVHLYGISKVAKKILLFISKGLANFAERLPQRAVTVIGKNSEYYICKNGSYEFLLDPKQYVDGSIYKYGVFEPITTKLIKRFIKNGMTIFDIGANFGYYTVEFSKSVGESGKVYAFEPSNKFRNRLLEHLKRNECKNVTVLDYGLSNKESVNTLYEGRDSATMHWIGIGEHQKPEALQTISLKTLDQFVDQSGIEKIDLIKVDIDGHEPHFLNGAERILSMTDPVIVLEISHINYYKAGVAAWDFYDYLIMHNFIIYNEETAREIVSKDDFLINCCDFSRSTNIFISRNKSKLEALFRAENV